MSHLVVLKVYISYGCHLCFQVLAFIHLRFMEALLHLVVGIDLASVLQLVFLPRVIEMDRSTPLADVTNQTKTRPIQY